MTERDAFSGAEFVVRYSGWADKRGQVHST